MRSNLFDDPAPKARGSKAPVEVALFVHRELKGSLLCSEHGENRYRDGKLVEGKILAWSLIGMTEEQLEAFRSWQMREPRVPTCLTFTIPEWLAKREGLI